MNKYSSKDLASIFGKKTLDEEKKVEEIVEEEFHAEPIGAEDNTAGVLTIKGGNISEYFKNKMLVMNKNGNDEREGDDSESDCERYVGFGFNNIKSDKCDNNSQSVKDYANYAFENPCLDLNSSPQVKPSRKRKSFGFANEGLDLNYPDQNNTPKKSKAEFEISETADCFVNPALNLDAPESNICNGAEFEVTRPEGQVSLDESRKKKKKKKKKRDTDVNDAGFVNSALNLDFPDREENKGTDFEVTRFQMGLDNDALDLSDENSVKKRVTFNDCVEYNTDVMKKKKGKTKLDKFEVQNDKIKRKKKRASNEDCGMVFVNEALNVETISDEIQDNELNEMNERKSRKQKRKKNRRMSNLETIEEAPEEKENEDALCEGVGKENDVICDLEIITLQDSIESIDVIEEIPKKNKKKKKKIAIEMINVENVNEDNSQSEESNETKKKKKKKGKKNKEEDKENEILQTAKFYIEEEIKDENISEKEKKKKKKRKSSETCEFFLDMIEENVQVEKESSQEKIKKKRSRDEIEICTKDEIFSEESTPSKKPRLEEEISSETSESPGQSVSKKSKSVFKSMFSKTTIVHFKGSNINDIKGYGVD